jgi:hypothetical protein
VVILACLIRLAVYGISFGLVGEVAAQTCTPPRAGLIGWWNAQAASATIVTDLKNGSPGSIAGGVAIVRGSTIIGSERFGSAFHFDGSGFITPGNQAAFQFGMRPFSLETWFRWDGAGSSVSNLVRKSNYPASNPGAGYWIRMDQRAQVLEFFVGETVGHINFPRTSMSTKVRLGIWHHVVGTKDNFGNMNLYLDGQQADQEKKIDPTFNVNADTPFTVGAWNDPSLGPREFFSGYMNEISVYNRSLTANEVEALFIAPKCAAKP